MDGRLRIKINKYPMSHKLGFMRFFERYDHNGKVIGKDFGIGFLGIAFWIGKNRKNQEGQ